MPPYLSTGGEAQKLHPGFWKIPPGFWKITKCVTLLSRYKITKLGQNSTDRFGKIFNRQNSFEKLNDASRQKTAKTLWRKFILRIMYGFRLYLHQKKRNQILDHLTGSIFSLFLLLWMSIVKSELCPHTFPKPWVEFSKSLGGPLTLAGIFQNHEMSFPKPGCLPPSPVILVMSRILS